MVVGLAVAVLLLFFGIPWLIRAFNTVSTDDAYVNGYVTFVAPRVSGQVTRVLVEDNNRVKKGDVLVELDPKPYQVQVRKELKKQSLNFDFIGLSLLVLTIICWEVVLSKGQEWDWLSDAFGRVQILVTLFLIGGAGLVFWEMRREWS